MDEVKHKIESFNDELMSFQVFRTLNLKTNLPASVFAMAIVTICVILVAFDVGGLAQVALCLVGVAYPAFKSILAINTQNKDDDKQWLTYWMIYSIFRFIDGSFAFLLIYIPFYNLISILVLIWL